MSEELAIVKGVGVGLRDAGYPILWFGVETMNSGSLQCFGWEDAAEIIKEAGCYDTKNLEGKPCIVEASGGLMKFVRWKK